MERLIVIGGVSAVGTYSLFTKIPDWINFKPQNPKFLAYSAAVAFGGYYFAGTGGAIAALVGMLGPIALLAAAFGGGF